MQSLTDSELQRAYAVWKKEAAKEDVLVLRELVVKPEAAAVRLRARATASNFERLKREAMGSLKDDKFNGEWSADQLDDALDKEIRKILFATPVGSLTQVLDIGDDTYAFYLIVNKRQRTVLSFSSERRAIEKYYKEYRETERWKSWLSSRVGPAEDDIAGWYYEEFASRH
jgi:parvulin-like peptidyl-prolyl isomerase